MSARGRFRPHPVRPAVGRAPERVEETEVVLLFAATGGATQKIAVVIANELAARGLRVGCLVPEARGPYLDRLAPPVRLRAIGSRRPPDIILGIARYLRRARPTAVLALQEHVSVAALLARRLSRVQTRLVVSSHVHLVGYERDRRALVRCVPFLVRRLFPGADRIVAVSRGCAEHLARTLRVPGSRIEVVYNPVVPPDLARCVGEAPDHPWFADSARPVILGMGNLVAQKDFPTLLRAFGRVRARRPVRLAIAGEGRDRQALEDLAGRLGIAADVDLVGFVANPDALMARAAAFSLSSAWEGFGNVVAEALACGCPVVSTDCPSGPAEILKGGAHGRLVPVGDDAALADALLATLAEVPDRDRLRARGATFSVGRAVDRYVDLLGLTPAGRPSAAAPS